MKAYPCGRLVSPRRANVQSVTAPLPDYQREGPNWFSQCKSVFTKRDDRVHCRRSIGRDSACDQCRGDEQASRHEQRSRVYWRDAEEDLAQQKR